MCFFFLSVMTSKRVLYSLRSFFTSPVSNLIFCLLVIFDRVFQKFPPVYLLGYISNIWLYAVENHFCCELNMLNKLPRKMLLKSLCQIIQCLYFMIWKSVGDFNNKNEVIGVRESDLQSWLSHFLCNAGEVQSYLRDTAGWAPEHCTKATQVRVLVSQCI